jgi:hypothetical protein
VYAKAKELGIGLLKPNGDALEVDSSYVKAYWLFHRRVWYIRIKA